MEKITIEIDAEELESKKNLVVKNDDTTYEVDPIESEKKLDSENTYKELTEVYFAFVDVLGFKRDFDLATIKGNYKDAADKYKDIFGYYIELCSFLKKNENTYIGQTSDSLYFYSPSIRALEQFILIYTQFSQYAMSKDVFLRGGISSGKLFRKDDWQFYGDSVINAYLMESNIAQYPILLIDKKTNEKIKLHSNKYDSLIITDDKRARYYVNPFYILETNELLDVKEGNVLKTINYTKIEETISNNLDIFEFDERVYPKYKFLHDLFLNKTGDN